MEMPALLREKLDVYRSCFNDKELLDQLTHHLSDLIIFFDTASDDETWSSNHSEFMQGILQFLTKRSFENKLEINDIKLIQRKIQEHHQILDSYLPRDLVIEVKGEQFHENSLLFSAASPIFQDQIRHDCFEKGSDRLILNDISVQTFEIVREFVKTGDVLDLWKSQEAELKELHLEVGRLGLNELAILCEHVLKRYINRDQVIPMLIAAHLDGWKVLRHACFEYINGLDEGVKFHESNIQYLALEFLDFKENAMEIFNQIKSLVTHLIFREKLIDERLFSDVVNDCPLLIHVNLSLTKAFSERIFDIPGNIQELDISSCNWLDQVVLNRIVVKFSNLKLLKIADNIQLNYDSWGLISKLKQLTALDISRNTQIQDDDFRLILQSCSQIEDLNCSDCKRVGDKGFFELTGSLTHLIFLNMERCQISDGILIELAVKLRFLEEINLTRCHLLSDRGVLELVKQSKTLKRVMIKQCKIKEETLLEIKHQKPYLQILF